MRSGFLINVIFVVTINLLVKPLYLFGIDRVVQNEVGASTYGLYFALFNFVYLFQLVNDFGIQNFNHSLFSRHDQLIEKYLPKTLGTKLLLIPSFAVVTGLAAFILGYRSIAFVLLAIILFNQVLASLVMLVRTTLSAKGYYMYDSALSVMDKIFMLMIFGYLLYFSAGEVKIVHFVLGQSASLFLALVIAIILLWLKTTIVFYRIKWDKAFMVWQLKKSYPFALVLLLMTLYTRMDGVMIERLLPDGAFQAGIYAASYRILDASNMLGLLVAGLLLPMFGKALNHPDQLIKLIRMSMGLLLSISLAVVLICFQYGDPIMDLLYEGATDYWSAVFKLLMSSYVAVCLVYIFSSYLTAAQDLSAMNRVFVGGVILNFLLNYILILKFQAWGAALATTITQTFTALFLVGIVFRKVTGIFSWIFMLRGLAYLVCIVLISVMVLGLHLGWVLKIILLAFSSLIMALLTKLIDPHGLFLEFNSDQGSTLEQN